MPTLSDQIDWFTSRCDDFDIDIRTLEYSFEYVNDCIQTWMRKINKHNWQGIKQVCYVWLMDEKTVQFSWERPDGMNHTWAYTFSLSGSPEDDYESAFDRAMGVI